MWIPVVDLPATTSTLKNPSPQKSKEKTFEEFVMERSCNQRQPNRQVNRQKKIFFHGVVLTDTEYAEKIEEVEVLNLKKQMQNSS